MNPQDEQRIREEFELKRKLQYEAEAKELGSGCRFGCIWVLVSGLIGAALVYGCSMSVN